MSKEIKVFSQANCINCVKVCRWLDQKGIKYSVLRVDLDEEALNTVLELGYNTTPVVVAGSDHWAGINLGKMESLCHR